MNRRLVLVSYTPLDAPGGVPRWNRDFVKCFPGTVHFSWWDFLRGRPNIEDQVSDVLEADKAHVLSAWLVWSKKVTSDDVVIGDGFWAAGFEGSPPSSVVSHSHGIWSHLMKEDVDAGKPPEFPENHRAQVSFRKRHVGMGRPLTAVSEFIAEQMQLQWGFRSAVIDNAVDLETYRPATKRGRARPIVVHGVNDRSNENKGGAHVELLKNELDADVVSLDEAAAVFDLPKPEALAQADLVVSPSGFEGNSYFVLETLACGVPIVAYDVGLLRSISRIARQNGIEPAIGCVIDRRLRSPEETLKVARFILESVARDPTSYNPRQVGEIFSLERFKTAWSDFLCSH